jgi:hypothetical protein
MSRYILCTAPQEAQAGAQREEAAAWAVSKSRLNVGPPQKKNPEQSILGVYSSLCLTLFCPGDFGGVGDGG